MSLRNERALVKSIARLRHLGGSIFLEERNESEMIWNISWITHSSPVVV